MIGIINYGLGNIKAFENIYNLLNIDHCVVTNKSDLRNVTKVILPGVGSFDYAMTRLEDSGLRPDIDRLVLKDKVPILGICVGMQMLANKSEEGILPGLGYINATVKKFDHKSLDKNPLPHMGWNSISHDGSELFSNIEKNAKYYFLHSFYIQLNDNNHEIANSNYEKQFSCAVNKENIYGCQFHPEKSHQAGIDLLKNFGLV